MESISKKIKRMKNKFSPKVKSKVKTTKGRDYSESDAFSLQISAHVSEQGELVFVTKGRWVSLNFIMAKAHWSTDSKSVDIIKKKVRDAIHGINLKLHKYQIVIRYNSKLDDHNCVMMPKYFTDAIKRNYLKDSTGKYIASKGEKILEFEGIIEDDDKRYSRGTSFFPDETLEHNTYIMVYKPVE